MGFDFRDWFGCPECDEGERISSLAHNTDIVFECYECGTISEFTFGEDLPLQNLGVNALADLTGEQASD